jgi:two-component system cell cycle sensor histidine kinase/response regulator CckA
MADNSKSNDQLLQELEQLRQRIGELEALEQGHVATLKATRAEKRLEGLNRLNEDLLSPGSIAEKMKCITDGLAKLLNADFARIWLTKLGDRCELDCRHAKVSEGPHLCRDRSRCLHLVASSGRYTHLDGSHTRVPFGAYKIGRVASAEDPGFLTNDVAHDPRVHNHDWARKLGLVSFAGYRLLSQTESPIGVLAIFSQQALTPDDETLLQTVAHSASQVVIASQSTESLRESEEKYRTLVEGSLQGVIIGQANPTRLSFVNPPMGTLTGFAQDELLAMDQAQLMELLHPGDRERFFKELARRMSGEDVAARDEYRILKSDGSTVWVQTYTTNITFGGDKAIMAAFVDDTERKMAEQDKAKLEEQYRHSQKMEAVGRLAGGVAHDFNNVLCSITGNASLVLTDLSADDPLHERIEGISKAAERAADLTRQLLAFSRKQVIEPKVIDLSQMVESLHTMLVRLIGEDVILKTVPQERLGRVRVDPGQIEQIVLNLAINARDAMPTGGDLLIETADVTLEDDYCEMHTNARPGPYVMLAVSDTGHGMSAEIRDKIFEPFFTTKELGQGTGLGLATVFGIVEQNGGRIEVYSEPGQGSTFKVYFPRVGESAEPLDRPQGAQIPGGSETVLVVEDDKMVRRLAQMLLEHLGYQVLSAGSGAEAIALAQQHETPIHLLLTDVVMPRINGRELAESLTGLQPGLKVIFTSGYTHNVIAQQGVLDEGVQFIAKPYTLGTLATKVRQVLDS